MNRDQISLLVIDDNPAILELYSTALESEALRIFTAMDPAEGIEIVFREHPQIVLTDLVMPGMNGLEVLDRIVAFDPTINVILMTAHYSSESAVEAIRRGAADYLNKPVSISILKERIGCLAEQLRHRQNLMSIDENILADNQFEGMVGKSPVMWELYARLRRIGPHYRSVLLTGETGTGKELAARALHRLSPVQAGNFVVLNCSAVVETLFESELFGHVRGAFTGADKDKTGLFEYADKSTIFLDEIGDMPLGTQAKLLRVLQNQEVLRVGSLTPRKIDIRVIAATHKDLRAAIAEKQFREDLYYRLSMIEVHTPSLSQRNEDIPLLAKFLIEKYARQFRKEISGLTQRAQLMLNRHHWPGNVRELENVIGHGCMMAQDTVIDIQDLPEYLRFASSVTRLGAATGSEDPAEDTFDEHERRLIADALERAAGNQSQAARMLRIGRDALRYKMKKHGLEVTSQARTAS
jgi:DNA-binding NtrC family response regulator